MAEYSAEQIVALIKGGPGPESLFASHDAAKKLADKHHAVVEKMLRLQGKLDSAWEGPAAMRAQSGAGPLVSASKVSAGHLSNAQNLYFGQGSSFNDVKNKVGDGPGPKPNADLLNGNPCCGLCWPRRQRYGTRRRRRSSTPILTIMARVLTIRAVGRPITARWAHCRAVRTSSRIPALWPRRVVRVGRRIPVAGRPATPAPD